MQTCSPSLLVGVVKTPMQALFKNMYVGFFFAAENTLKRCNSRNSLPDNLLDISYYVDMRNVIAG